MTSKEFFAAVCKLRSLQKHIAKYGEIDQMAKNDLRRQEKLIDEEIKRVDAVLREKAQPRFFEI